ncbi:MAG: hypothetical protein ABSC48_12850 [Terracidiphilus sp.]
MKSFVFARVSPLPRQRALFSLLMLALGGLMLPAAARAQTASFRYAIATLGGGFGGPAAVAVDGGGNVYVTDSVYNAVYEMPPGCASSSCVTTLGGGFYFPYGVAVDGNGNVYVGDTGNNAVKEMPAGCASSSCVTTLGGGFDLPLGVAVDGSGNVYVADFGNYAVKEMPAGCASSSCVTTLGGGFNTPNGVAVDGSGNVYVADTSNKAVKEMPAGCASSSCVTTLGGGFNNPYGVAVDGSGNVYVADVGNSAVNEIPAGCASSSCVTTLGGGFYSPEGVAVDASGNVYVADNIIYAVQEIMTHGVNFFSVPVGTASAARTLTFTFDSAGSLSSTTPYQVLTEGAKNLDFNAAAAQGSNLCNGTTAYTAGETCTVTVTFTPTVPGTRYGAAVLYDTSGNGIATAYLQGTGIGPLVSFLPGTQNVVANVAVNGLSDPYGVAVDASGNVYIADYGKDRVLKETLSAGGYTQSVVANSAINGLDLPYGVAVDGSGNVYIADTANSQVLKETLSAGGYTQSVIANSAINGLDLPDGVAVDGSGNVYIADSGNNRVLMETLSAGSYTQSVVANAANNGLRKPSGVAVDGSGNVYIADTGNNRVLMETPSAGSYTQSVVANAANNGLIKPFGVAVDGSGNVYIADSGNSRVLLETPSAGSYTQSVVANAANNGLHEIVGVAVDGSGNVYIADSGNIRVLKEDFVNPPSLAFAPTAMGSTSTDSPQTVTVNNIGNAALNFLAIGFPDPFIEFSPGTDTCGTELTLASGATCTFTVGFAPVGLGSFSDSVVLVDNSLNQTYAVQEIPVSGTGLSPQAITFTDSLPASANYSAGLAYTLSATGGGSGNPVVFSLVSGPATLAGSALTITGAGTVVVAANQAGNATYAAAPEATQSITIKTASQTISFTAITGAQYAATQIALSATATSGLAVTFTSGTTSVCSVAGNTLSLLIPGTCIVHAAQAGNTTYAAAPTQVQSFAVNLAPQTITFTAITGKQYATTQVPLTATASSGLTVTFSSTTTTICTVAGSTLSLLTPGTCIVHAAQAGNSVYASATTAQSFAVSLDPQTITFTPITGSQYAGTQVTLTATASSGLAVTFSSTTTSICSVSGNTLSLLTAGTCVVHAAQAGNSVYASATTAQSFAVKAAL